MPSITPPTFTETFSDFFAACRAKYMTEPTDNVYRERVTTKWVKGLSGGGNRVGAKGGFRIEFNVRLGQPPGASDLTFGGTDTITPQELEAVTVGLSGFVEKFYMVKLSKDIILSSSGSYQKYNYVKEQIDNFTEAWNADENTDLWAATQDAKKINSLAVTVSTTTTTGTLFETLNRASFSNWRQTNTDAGGSAFTSVGLNNMRTNHWAVTKGTMSGRPDTIFWSSNTQALWERVTDAKEQTEMATEGEGKAPIISESAVFRTCRIYPDLTDYPNNTTLRMLNSKYWHYDKMLEEFPGEASSPVDGRWWAYPVGCIRTLWCDGLRWQGIVSNFAPS